MPTEESNVDKSDMEGLTLDSWTPVTHAGLSQNEC